MADVPKITVGLNQFSPELFQRMGDAIGFAERNDFGDRLDGFKVFPSFWATITGFTISDDAVGEDTRIRRFQYLWRGGGLSSGESGDEDFAPAINLAEIRNDGQPETFLGLSVEKLKLTGLKNMPYITSNTPISNSNGELNKGNTPGDYFTGGTGPTVRMYQVALVDPDDPFSFNDLTAVYAFSASPNFDGPCGAEELG